MSYFQKITYGRVILAIVFFAAGILKILNPDNTVDIITFFQIASYEQALFSVYFFAVFEIGLSLLLITGYYAKVTGKLVLILCSIFLLFAVIGYLDNWSIACGCFGRFSFGRFDLPMIGRNTILLFVAIWLNYRESFKQHFSLSQAN